MAKFELIKRVECYNLNDYWFLAMTFNKFESHLILFIM